MIKTTMILMAVFAPIATAKALHTVALGIGNATLGMATHAFAPGHAIGAKQKGAPLNWMESYRML